MGKLKDRKSKSNMHFSSYLKHLPSSRKKTPQVGWPSLPVTCTKVEAEEYRTILKILLLACRFLNEQSHEGCGKELCQLFCQSQYEWDI